MRQQAAATVTLIGGHIPCPALLLLLQKPKEGGGAGSGGGVASRGISSEHLRQLIASKVPEVAPLGSDDDFAEVPPQRSSTSPPSQAAAAAAAAAAEAAGAGPSGEPVAGTQQQQQPAAAGKPPAPAWKSIDRMVQQDVYSYLKPRLGVSGGAGGGWGGRCGAGGRCLAHVCCDVLGGGEVAS